jgi:hypothetical protein
MSITNPVRGSEKVLGNGIAHNIQTADTQKIDPNQVEMMPICLSSRSFFDTTLSEICGGLVQRGEFGEKWLLLTHEKRF